VIEELDGGNYFQSQLGGVAVLAELPLWMHTFLRVPSMVPYMILTDTSAERAYQVGGTLPSLVICRGFQTRAGLGQGFGGYGLGSGFPDPAIPLTRGRGPGGCAATRGRTRGRLMPFD
jgi:hypothetical protein